MKSLPTSILLVVAAIMQALGIFRYTDDTMSMSGQVFFPILFALMTTYVTFKKRDHDRFSTLHLVVLGLSVITFVLTLAGSIGKLYYFYPSQIIYYVALGLLVVDLAFHIAAMPKAEKVQKPGRKRKKAPARTANLVARPKNAEEKEAGE